MFRDIKLQQSVFCHVAPSSGMGLVYFI